MGKSVVKQKPGYLIGKITVSIILYHRGELFFRIIIENTYELIYENLIS